MRTNGTQWHHPLNMWKVDNFLFFANSPAINPIPTYQPCCQGSLLPVRTERERLGERTWERGCPTYLIKFIKHSYCAHQLTHMSKWPRRTVYDRCYSSNSYPQKCEIYFQVKKLELNESACKRPLVETEHNSSWYEGIEGCGIQCENPIFTTVEHTRIHRFVGAFGSLSFICSLFTMVCHQPSLITAPSTCGVGTCLSF